MPIALTADHLITPTEIIDHPILLIEDGHIQTIASRSTTEIPNATHLGYPGHTLVPAFLDLHTHGAAGHDVMEASPEALETIGRFLAAHGTARYLPTTVTAPLDATLHSLEALANAIESPHHTAARPIGIHLEGPFLSHTKRGVHPPAQLREPSIVLFDRLWQAARGHIRLMTLAPELPGALALIAHATARGVRVSLGHSNATAAETLAAIDAGATSATHTFNAMRPLDHREPGILGTVLDREDLYAELICDGIHVAPPLVRLWLRCKGPHCGLLVTDSISATGMPDGTYTLGDFPVQLANGRATSNGALAGSVLTLDHALRNLMEFTGTTLETAARLASANPASLLGLEAPLSPGTPADFAVLAPDGSLRATLLHGQPL